VINGIPTRGLDRGRFVERVAMLRALEGWYFLPARSETLYNGQVVEYYERRIKLSCKWKDIVRASESKHFTSCFSVDGCHNLQSILRLYQPTWAVIYMPDRAGNVQCRVYCEFTTSHESESVLNCSCSMCKRTEKVVKKEEKLWLSRVYGNGFSISELKLSLQNVVAMGEREDIYL
jgi:hypothetical protein